MVSDKMFKTDKKDIKSRMDCSNLSVYEMMLFEDLLTGGDGSSHDVCDKIYDVCMCWDLPDEIDEEDDLHYDEAITDIMKHVPFVAFHGETWEADVSQFVRDHVDLVYELSKYFVNYEMQDKDLDKTDFEYEEDDSLYQGVQTIMAIMPGYGTKDMHELIINYFKKKEEESNDR